MTIDPKYQDQTNLDDIVIARVDEENFDFGNTRIIGPSGAGKSALLNTLLASYKEFQNASAYSPVETF